MPPIHPPGGIAAGLDRAENGGRTAGDVSLPAPSAGGRRRIPRRRGGRLSLWRKKMHPRPPSGLPRSFAPFAKRRRRGEGGVKGGGATDAAFINMDDFGEGLGARPLLARRACDVPPSVPPRIGLSGCALRAAALAHRLAHVLGFPSVLCPSLAVYNGRPANSIRLVCSRLFWRGRQHPSRPWSCTCWRCLLASAPPEPYFALAIRLMLFS